MACTCCLGVHDIWHYYRLCPCGTTVGFTRAEDAGKSLRQKTHFSLAPLSGLTFRCCCAKLRFAIHFMLRAAVLHPFLRGIQRFSPASHPAALVACCVTPWQLPRPDLHRLADDSFRTHQPVVRLCRLPFYEPMGKHLASLHRSPRM